jgi:predicted permease
MRRGEIRPGIRRLFGLGLRRDRLDEADAEIRLHLQLRMKQLVSEGWSPEAARLEAERRFGSLDEERQRFAASSHRRERRMRFRDWLDTVGQDVRYAFRTLRRDAGFAVFALLIVGLGVGASATVFSLVDGVLLRPMPFRDAARLVWISNIGDDGIAEWRLQVNHFLDLGRRSQSLDGLAAYNSYYGIGDAILSTGGDVQRLTRVPVTCNFVSFLGVAPIVGRTFSADDCVDHAAPTVLLSEATWRRQFAADPAIAGKTITIDDAPVTVIGVLPASFDFASVFAPGAPADMFSPFPLSDATNNQGNTLAVVGRLRPGVSVEQARAEIVSIGKQLMAEFPRRNAFRAKVLPLDARVNGRVRPALFLLSAAIAGVMLIVISNLASLQFARTSARRREMAVRVAIGATRGRLLRQTLTESLVLAGGGALLGVALALLGTRLVSHLSAFDIPLLARVGVNVEVIAVAALAAVVTGVVVGVLPALRSPADARDALSDASRGSTRGAAHARVRATLVVLEVAAACALMVVSSLLLRSFMQVLDVRLGYRPERTAALKIDPPRRFADLTSANSYYDDVLRRVRAVPGITHAAIGDLLPFTGDRSWSVAGEGQVYPRGQAPEAFIRVVSDGYFQTLGISLRAGRDFSEADSPDAPHVVIVNESLAHTLWPGRDAVGQAIGNGSRRLLVVGVVGDVRHTTLEHPFTGELYYPLRQYADHHAENLVVHTSLDAAALAASARTALAPIAAGVEKNPWQPLQQFIDKVASPRRFVVSLLSGFAAFAIVLAALGIYALVAYGVSQRTQEIGIRLALGASARSVRASVMAGTLALAGTGMALGLVAAMILAPLVGGMLFGVGATDPASYVIALATLGAAAVAAGYLPARRAASVDPSVALKG